MPPTDAEFLAARLARMKHLVESLEKVGSGTEEQRELFQKLKGEMAAARDALKIVPPPGFD
jgi:hypothetical protein